ncbi:MAG: EamA family transporter [Xanthobacteraceae bacterium]
MLGGFFALLAAVTFALNNTSARRGVLTGTLSQAMAITVPMGVPIFFLATLAAGSLGSVLEFSPEAIVALSAAGIVHFVGGRYCNYRATRAMGANLVGPLQQISLVLTLVLAILVLGETLTPLRLLGIGLVVLGPTITLRGDAEKRTRPPRATDQAESAVEKLESGRPAAFVVNYTEGAIFALLSALAYGISPILVRFGLGSGGLGVSLAAGLVSYCAATVVMLPALLWPGWMRQVLAVDKAAVTWFSLSGVTVCVSQMFLYMGFAVAPVSVVSPIQRLSIVFRIYFGQLLNPDHEVFGGKLYLGTFVSLLGAIALSLSTELVLSYIALPDWAAAVARWQWP